MKFLSGVLFSAKELQELVVVSEACVRVERQVRHIALLPHCLRDLKSAIIGTLKLYQKKFDVSCSGIILDIKNVKLITDRATLINDDPSLHLDIEADFYIFTPKVGCTLFGIVNKKGVNHIGCLVHKCFHVTIPRPTEEAREEWLGTSVNIGDQVTFSVEVCDFTGSLPYIRGKLINLSSQCVTLMKEDAVDGMSKQKKKKRKKGEQSSESAECDLLANNVEQEEMESILGTEHKKRKRHFEDEGETGAERKKRKKKKKQEVKDYQSVYCQTQEEEDLYFPHLSSEDAFMTSQKSPVMDKVESDSCIIDEYCKTKKEKRKKRDLNNVKLSYIQNKNDKPTAKEESLVGLDIPVQDQSLGSVTGNVAEAQVIAAPSMADLLNRVKSKLKVKLPKKHKMKDDDHDETKSDESDSHLLAISHGENKRKKSDKSHHKKKQHNSKKSKEKASVSFDPAAKLAEYISKFEANRKHDVANECHSSKEDVADSNTSNTSFRSSFCLTGAGMANAADRRRKKMNKGKGDAIPVRRSLPLLPSSRPCSEADRHVGQDIVRSHSTASSIESPKSSADECGMLQTPEKCFTRNEVSRSPKTGISNKVEISLASPKEGLGSNLSFLSPKQVTSPEKTPFRSILSQKGTSDSHLLTVASVSSRKNSKKVSDVNSSKTKDQTPVSSGYARYLNVGKVPTHAKSHGTFVGRELINAGVILPHHSDVLQRLKSPSVDARWPVMCELSPLQAKSVNDVSTDLVKETVTPETKYKLKTKKKHKEKKSKSKDKGGEHIERKQKKKDSQDHKSNRKGQLESGLGIQNELVDRREEHREENTAAKGKQNKSKEKDTKVNLEELKILSSKLLSIFLQQGN